MADIVKQKLPENNGGYRTVGFGHTHDRVYNELTSDNPIDLARRSPTATWVGPV